MLSICYKSRMENKLEIKLDRTWKTESFICKYTSKDIKFAKGKDEWKNNPTTNLNILYAKKEKNISCLRFKTQLKLWKQIILLTIWNKEWW